MYMALDRRFFTAFYRGSGIQFILVIISHGGTGLELIDVLETSFIAFSGSLICGIHEFSSSIMCYRRAGKLLFSTDRPTASGAATSASIHQSDQVGIAELRTTLEELNGTRDYRNDEIHFSVEGLNCFGYGIRGLSTTGFFFSLYGTT